MKLGAVLAAIILGVLLLCSPGRAQTGSNTVLIGDSLAEGVRPHLKPDYYLTVRGSSSDYFERSPLWISHIHRESQVVLLLGTNDKIADLKAYSGTVYALLAKIQARNPRSILWVGPPCSRLPEWDQRLSKVDETLLELINDLSPSGTLKYMSLYELTTSSGLCVPSDFRASDGIHFTPRGYFMLSTSIRDVLEHQPGKGIAP